MTSLASKGMRSFWNKNFSCTAMLLDNLAKPEWIPVDCNERLAEMVLCTSRQNLSHLEKTIQVEGGLYCEKKNILKNSTCYSFDWQERSASKQRSNVSNIDMWKFLFDAVSLPFLPIFSANLSKFVTFRQCHKT